VDGLGELGCGHVFCISCIRDWAAVNPRCPLCKTPFQAIVQRMRADGPVTGVLPVAARRRKDEDGHSDSGGSGLEDVACRHCESAEQDDSLLLCDGPDCEAAYHLWCLQPPLAQGEVRYSPAFEATH
jgi:PHD and RING finger domain-containing protein 1